MVSRSVVSETQILTPDWQWCYWEDLPYLTCSLLGEWQHGFFTQQFSPRTPEELVQVLQPDASVYRVKQVHGNQLLTPTEIEVAIAQENIEDRFPCADGIITDWEQQAVWVASADCTPVLIGDVQTGRVTAIHAGWRGTAKRIVPEAIARFLYFGSSLENLRIAMGPAISGEVYQVTEQVAAEIGRCIIPKEQADTTEAILDALQQFSDSPLREDPEPEKVRIDVRRVNAIAIEQLGISSKQVAIAPYCTYQQPEYFFSYRRTKEKNVQWSGIVSNSDNNAINT